MLVVIAITSLVLTSVAVALHSLFGVERNLRRSLAVAGIQARLNVQWRADAHRASAVDVVAGDGETVGGVVFTLPDDYRVEYRTEAGCIVRVAKAGETIRHREVFRLGESAHVAWSIERQPAAAIVCLTVSRPPTGTAAAEHASRTDCWEAVVGLDTIHSRLSSGE